MKKNLRLLIYSLTFIGVFIILTNSCKKEDEPVIPELSTTSISSITQQTASGGGNITSDGGSPVTARGICWGTSADPTTSGSKTSDGSGTGSFTSSITGLTAGTEYHVRAYATNSVGTAYGNDVTFNSSDALVPTLTSTSISSITTTTASSGGNISSDGGSSITARGVCWSTSSGPTTADSKTSDGSGGGSFSSSITGLTAATTYYLRAYATNSVGTSYGNEISFTTTLPLTLYTTAISDITQTTATSGGNITIDGGSDITARGICWSTSTGPTTSDNTTSNGSGTGTFTSTMSGLTAGTTYYVRAYATNSDGTTYGNELSFSSGAAIPTLSTTAISAITATTASSGGDVTSDGGSPVTQHGICWSTSTNPTIDNSLTYNGSGTGTYTSDLYGLTANTTYYVRAWATNSVGTAYGNELTFSTNPVVLATLTTTTITSITQNTASSGGTVTDDGGALILSSGVCWSTSANPTTGDSKTSDALVSGSIVSSITDLTAGTTYYVRAYATNSAGTAYGDELSFTTTAAVVPTLSTTAISSITQTTAMSGGNITNSGGAPVTQFGICWSTSPSPTTADFKDTPGYGTGAYASALTGLTHATTYYVRAYATNIAGTAYGDELSFTTSPGLASLTNTALSSITQTSASSGGNITDDGGAEVTERGVCWKISSSGTPTIADDKTSDGSGTGPFTSSITGLSGNTSYYVRAYATNSAGTAYGPGALLLTTSPVEPSLSTTAITSITQTTASSGGNITSTGGASIIARGVCWSTFSSPTIADDKTTNGAASGSFSSSITGLTENTTYYVRAYATNSVGTSYGDELSFTSSAALPPTLTTTAISSIGKSVASSGGNITSDGGGSISERGVCWSTSTSPTIADSKSSDGTTTGTFTSSITGLSATTTYYVRAYATNSGGTAYGNEVSFTSMAHDIGETYQGGIIGYILQPGDAGFVAGETHGLIAAPSDQSAGITWYNGSNTLTQAWGETIGTGSANTTKMINFQGSGGAAYACTSLTLDIYSDWYLPSLYELYVIYLSKTDIGGFADDFYWSSTEYNNGSYNSARMVDFTTGSVNTITAKSALKRVRAIRSF